VYTQQTFWDNVRTKIAIIEKEQILAEFERIQIANSSASTFLPILVKANALLFNESVCK
jgi:hypothetical protein